MAQISKKKPDFEVFEFNAIRAETEKARYVKFGGYADDDEKCAWIPKSASFIKENRVGIKPWLVKRINEKVLDISEYKVDEVEK